MSKGTCQTEAASCSVKIMLVALAIIELWLSEGIKEGSGWVGSHAGMQACRQQGWQMKIRIMGIFSFLKL